MVFERCKDLGLLLGKGGQWAVAADRWLGLCPPGLSPPICEAHRPWPSLRSSPLVNPPTWPPCRCAPATLNSPAVRPLPSPLPPPPPPPGLYGNAFRIKPPMCWTKQDVDFAVAVMDQALSEL